MAITISSIKRRNVQYYGAQSFFTGFTRRNHHQTPLVSDQSFIADSLIPAPPPPTIMFNKIEHRLAVFFRAGRCAALLAAVICAAAFFAACDQVNSPESSAPNVSSSYGGELRYRAAFPASVSDATLTIGGLMPVTIDLLEEEAGSAVVSLPYGAYSYSLRLSWKDSGFMFKKTETGSFAVSEEESSQEISFAFTTSDFEYIPYFTFDDNVTTFLSYAASEPDEAQFIAFGGVESETELSEMLKVINKLPDGSYIKLDLSDCNIDAMSNSGLEQNVKSVVSLILPQTLQILINSDFTTIFNGWDELESVICPPSLLQMDNYVFSGLKKLKTVDFSACTMLKVISSYAFQDSKELTTVEWPPALETIGSKAFGDGSTSGITASNIASNKAPNKLLVPDFSKMPMLKNIGDYAFAGCFRNGVDPDTDEALPLIEIDLSQTALTSIGEGAFQGCVRIEKVIFPASLKTIGKLAFGTVSNGLRTTAILTACWNLAIPDFSKTPALESIGESAFDGCFLVYPPDDKSDVNNVKPEDLETIDLSQTALTSIGTRAFNSNTRVGKVIFPASLKTISANAFSNNTSASSISASASDTNIARYCVNLEDVDFSRCTQLDSIGSSAFNGCAKLLYIDLSQTALTSIGASAFANCTSLTTVKLPAANDNGTLTIGATAFSKCDGMTACVLYAELPPTLSNVSAFPYKNGSSINENFKIYVPARSKSFYEKIGNWASIYKDNNGIFLPLDYYVEI